MGEWRTAGLAAGRGPAASAHAEEMMLKLPEKPVVFLNPRTSVFAAGEVICSPAFSRQVDFDGELAKVIDRQAKQISEAKTGTSIIGYSCATMSRHAICS